MRTSLCTATSATQASLGVMYTVLSKTSNARHCARFAVPLPTSTRSSLTVSRAQALLLADKLIPAACRYREIQETNMYVLQLVSDTLKRTDHLSSSLVPHLFVGSPQIKSVVAQIALQAQVTDLERAENGAFLRNCFQGPTSRCGFVHILVSPLYMVQAAGSTPLLQHTTLVMQRISSC